MNDMFKNKYNAYITEVMFEDFDAIKEYLLFFQLLKVKYIILPCFYYIKIEIC